MINQKYKVFVFAFLLFSTTLILSPSLAFNERSNLVVDSNNSPYVISTFEEFNAIDVSADGMLIIASSGEIVVHWVTLNLGTIIIDGTYIHFGSLRNFGDFFERCGLFDGTGATGIRNPPTQIQC